MLPQSEITSLEQRAFELEQEKFKLEKEKVRVERLKAWTTGGSIVITLLIAALTIAFGVWSQHKQVMAQLAIQDQQAKAQLAIQDQQAKSQFEIKAAEIVMNTDVPGVTHNKAKALLALFPEMLPSNFAASFDPGEYADRSRMPPELGRGFYSALGRILDPVPVPLDHANKGKPPKVKSTHAKAKTVTEVVRNPRQHRKRG